MPTISLFYGIIINMYFLTTSGTSFPTSMQNTREWKPLSPSSTARC